MAKWFPSHCIPSCVERVSKVAGGGIRFIGSPVGAPEFCKAWCMDNVKSFEDRVRGITLMKDKQAALLLLRLTHATRFCHVIRTTHPDITADACVVMDTITLAGLRKIINVALLSDIQIKQAMLPMRIIR